MNFFKTLAMVGLVGVGMAYGRDVSVDDAFRITLPDSSIERTRVTNSEKLPNTILAKYHNDAFNLSMYRWSTINASVPLDQIPYQWKKNKEWASVSNVSEGKTDSGIPYVTFNTRITQGARPHYDSVMTVVRSEKGDAYMFQMTGDPKILEAIRQSIRFK